MSLRDFLKKTTEAVEALNRDVKAQGYALSDLDTRLKNLEVRVDAFDRAEELMRKGILELKAFIEFKHIEQRKLVKEQIDMAGGLDWSDSMNSLFQ